MRFFEEAEVLKNAILLWVGSLVAVSCAVFFVGFGTTEISQHKLYFPAFSSRSFAVIIFQEAQRDSVPEGVTVIATSPISALIGETKIALFGAFIITLPLLIYTLLRYLSPALYAREKKAMLKVLVSSAILFLSGAVFAYIILVPPLFRVFYSFNTVLGVTPFFAIDELISWTVGLMFAVGIMFLLPILMYFLSVLRIIHPVFWSDHWRGALMSFLVVSAVIVPDVSGVAMILLSLPMFVLYLAGIGLSTMTIKGAHREAVDAN